MYIVEAEALWREVSYNSVFRLSCAMLVRISSCGAGITEVRRVIDVILMVRSQRGHTHAKLYDKKNLRIKSVKANQTRNLLHFLTYLLKATRGRKSMWANQDKMLVYTCSVILTQLKRWFQRQRCMSPWTLDTYTHRYYQTTTHGARHVYTVTMFNPPQHSSNSTGLGRVS